MTTHMFLFKESKIWEAGNPIDPEGRECRIKLQKDDQGKAFRKLPPAGTGRQWILIARETR